MLPEPDFAPVVVMYDGECPACSCYVRFVRLREAAGKVDLINLRERPDLVRMLRSEGRDVNEGMVVQVGIRRYFGADAVTAMALMSSRSGIANRLNRAVFGSKIASRALYPAMRAGRYVLLKALGRRPL
jgi:predicted DCC family thiol-disulfide oxidoreductase YuxK